MTSSLHVVATGIFCVCFLLVTLAGFWAVRWKRGDLNSLEEWGLAGRRFGTLVTWFLIGGDFYTAYTIIAVPAALYGTGARVLCDTVLHSTVSLHDAGASATVAGLSSPRLCDPGRFCARSFRQQLAFDCYCADRNSGDDALHRFAACRHARGDRGSGN